MMKLHRLLLLFAAIGIATLSVSAKVTEGVVRISYVELADDGIKVINVWNDADKRIFLEIDGKNPITVLANSSAQLNRIAYKYVKYNLAAGSGRVLWKHSPKNVPVTEAAPVVPTEIPDKTPDRTQDKAPDKAPNRAEPDAGKQNEQRAVHASDELNEISNSSSTGYAELINKDAFFGTEAVNAYTQKVDEYCKGIDSSKNKPQFIIDNDVRQFLEDSRTELAEKKSNLASIVKEIIHQSDIDASSQSNTVNLIVEILSNRIKTREDAFNKLDTLVESTDYGKGVIRHGFGEDVVNYGIVGAIILVLIILIIVTVRRKKSKRNRTAKSVSKSVSPQEQLSDNPAIVVRRRTTSILKRQCIDDVIDNTAYLVINSSDFTPDSSVKKIYVKNSCIKDIYNLYAEDLRNSENPKEDGCMVLGRWVHDEANHTYDISLEEVVLPGDDAVFKEYELNFGGKIRLRIAEKLRKLRRNTNLQYDLVCWIHSHPGLGVFFSNSDVNVQMQLKHSQHPNFLIAFVVDILTSNQEMGIFTFRKDGDMNSKGDLTKMYSLEEMYKWALQSESNSFSHDNYYNILDNAKLKMPSCHGVELNNSSIIDLTQIVIEPATGMVGWVIGTTVDDKSGQEYAVSSIVRNAEKPTAGIIGCLISMAHMSFPTIQRMIARDSVNLSFVMVYSSKQMSLTTIPVINGELLSDEQFYGDVNIDDLKIWTRRKR